MKEPTPITYLHPPPEVEALQFERLVEIYVELGLTRPQAAAAAQADYLCGNIVAFRRRDTLRGAWMLLDLREVAA